MDLLLFRLNLIGSQEKIKTCFRRCPSGLEDSWSLFQNPPIELYGHFLYVYYVISKFGQTLISLDLIYVKCSFLSINTFLLYQQGIRRLTEFPFQTLPTNLLLVTIVLFSRMRDDCPHPHLSTPQGPNTPFDEPTIKFLSTSFKQTLNTTLLGLGPSVISISSNWTSWILPPSHV